MINPPRAPKKKRIYATEWDTTDQRRSGRRPQSTFTRYLVAFSATTVWLPAVL